MNDQPFGLLAGLAAARVPHQRALRPLFRLVLCGALLASLQGCVEMVVGGAVLGTLAATDRRTLGAQTEDKAITLKGEQQASRIPGATHVNVASFNRKVLLTGQVVDEQVKAAVEREIAAIEGVQSVVNELELGGISSFSSRSNDAFITTMVTASLVDTRDLNANVFKVTTESGVVYLMGRVTQREGTVAGEVARGVNGVRKVVKIFEYFGGSEPK